MVVALLAQGERLHLWKLEESNKALPLNPKYLDHVTDSASLENQGEMGARAYYEAVVKSSLTSLGAFANSADSSVSYANLFSEPVQFRGKVIHYEGIVRLIRHMNPPAMVLAKGVEDLYECWLYGKEDGYNHPVCLVCTELPRGVSPGEKLNLQASFDAYFFMRLSVQGSRFQTQTGARRPCSSAVVWSLRTRHQPFATTPSRHNGRLI